jgi:hypothetical protein
MPAPRREELSTVGGLALLGSFGSFIVAIIFGTMSTVHVSAGGSGEAPNITSAGAACGFAIASGLCLVAAAIAESGARRREPPSREPSSPPSGGPG